MSFSIPNPLNIVDITPEILLTYSGAPDWVSITGAVTNEVLFLVNDAASPRYTINTTFTRPGSENIYIDWGDGSPIDTISTVGSTDNVHTYTSGGTASSRGYNTWKIRIYGDAGTRITGARIDKNSGDQNTIANGLLQAWYGDNTVTSMTGYFRVGTRNTYFSYLEYVRVPEGLTASNGLEATFDDCRALQKVDLPTSLSAITTLSSTFLNTSSLYSVSDFPVDMTGVTSLASVFENSNITRVVFRGTLNSCTTAVRAFSNCGSLGSVILPPLSACTNYDLTYSNCFNLRSASFPKLPNTNVSMGQTFLNNRKLQNVYLDPDTTGTLNGISFNGCPSLKVINLPPNCNLTTYANMFNGCASLVEVSLPMNATNVTNFGSAFGGCFALQNVTLPTTAPTATISFASAFQNCHSLSEIIIPSGYTISSLSSAFDACYSLQNVSLPDKSSYTDLSNAFRACFLLEEVTLPTNLSGVTTLSQTFQNCYALKEVTFPSTMNNVITSGNLFANCYSLQKVTLPTSMTSLGTTPSTLSFVNMFANCRSLEEIVMPTTIGSSQVAVTMNSFASTCYALKSITLPTTRTTALNTATSAFNACPSLTGITNIEYFGDSGSTSTNYVNGTGLAQLSYNLLSLDFYCKFSKLELNGTDTSTNFSRLASLRLRNNGAGQYGGTSPHINISFTNLSQAALVQVFNDLPTVTGKTINITSATGAASLTAGERAIATGKGWTIVG